MTLFRRPSWTTPDHDPEAFQASLVDHLEELRTRLFRCLIALVIGWIIGWFIEPWFYGLVDRIAQRSIIPQLPKGVEFKEVFHSATAPFMLKMKLSLSLGLIVVIPFIVLQLWGFVAPGLRPREQAPFRRLAPASAILFVIGASLGWYTMPSALGWFASYAEDFPGTNVFQEAGGLATLFIKMMTAFGIAFQLPVIVFALGMLNLLSAATLMKYWRHSATFIFIAAAVITPSNDPFSMLMMAIPMVILFMGSVYAVKYAQRNRPILPEDSDEESPSLSTL